MSRTDIITKEQIWELTENGRLVFETILGKIPRNKIKSPLRDDGNIPAFSVFRGDEGIWLFKDFGGNGDSGTAIDFVMKMYGQSYYNALKYIKEGMNFEPIVVESVEKSYYSKKEPTLIEVTAKKFDQLGHQYWNSFCLSEDFLKQDDIYQISKYAINKKMVKIPENQAVFAYYAKDVDKFKLLTIGEDVEKKWVTNLKSDYLWYYFQYKEPIEDLFVVKSVKDKQVLRMLNYKGVALQNEGATTFLKSNVNKIKKLCERPIIVMGSDTQGFQTSLDITQATGFRWFNTKKYMLKFGVNDPASFCKEFSLELLDKQIKQDLKKWKIN